MSNSIIQVSNLSKSYTISHKGRERYTALRDVMAQKAKKIFSFPSSLRGGTKKQSPYKEEFWALKDLSFDIEQGDRVGIIGRNGAGKSTLLKILSRITEPTTGSIKIKGRVASLLEVGTGFHPELTGRENIFLNGAILGMSRVEIKKHFDAIVDFAEVEKFLDTPVKRYSSGMYVRLAFAVAAHLEPEILIVDEVLAVGDAQFQKKCLGKMEDVSKNEGRTVLFVSHNMSAILQLCRKGILLANGNLLAESNIDSVVANYLALSDSGTTKSIFLNKNPDWNILSLKMVQNSVESAYINSNEPVEIILEFESKIGGKISLEFLVKDQNNNPLLFIPLGIMNGINFDCHKGIYRVEITLKLPQLALGKYQIDLYIVETGVRRIVEYVNAFSFEIAASYVKKSGWIFERSYNTGSILYGIESHKFVELE